MNLDYEVVDYDKDYADDYDIGVIINSRKFL